MVSDLLIGSLALAMAAGTTTPANADAACRAADDTFTGWEMAGDLLGDLAFRQAVDPDLACRRRGYLLRNADGRFGVSLGAGAIIEPAGREYAITPYEIGRWGEAWRVDSVTYQSGRLPALPA